MNTDIREKRQLWRQVFGDTEEFLDAFFSQAYAPHRCNTIYMDGKLAGVVYWLDCTVDGKKAAYIYALATRPEFRGRGLAKTLMEKTQRELKAAGYCAVLLVPGSESLFRFYERMGYRVCGYVREFSCITGETAILLRRVDMAEYACLRRKFLPAGGVIQEGENLLLLDALAELYAGEDFLLACAREGDTLRGLELLGDIGATPGTLKALSCASGTFRTPGEDKPFAMYLPLEAETHPAYFGLAFD